MNVTEVLGCDWLYNILFTVSRDTKELIEHTRAEFENSKLVFKGWVGELNGEKYALFRDEEEIFWLLGDPINPIKITEETTALLEGRQQRCLTIKQGDEVLLKVDYTPKDPTDGIPPIFDFTAASMDTTRGNFGLFVYEMLNNLEKKQNAWSKTRPAH